MQALIVRTTAESGDGIVRFRQRLAQDNFRVPLQLQVLEGDYLDISRTMGFATGSVVQGVQFNLFGQREAYWLYNYQGQNPKRHDCSRNPPVICLGALRHGTIPAQSLGRCHTSQIGVVRR